MTITSVISMLRRIHDTGKPARILYVSDFDRAGRKMPNAVARQCEFWRPLYAPESDIRLQSIVLTQEQIDEHELPSLEIAEEEGDEPTGDVVELDALKGRKEEIEELERDRDALLEQYAEMVTKGLEAFGPEERHWAYKLIRLNVFADAEGNLTATWMFTRASVIQENARQDEGNAYARLGEVLQRLGRKDEARAAYERGVQQAEKFGHSGMADDLRVALIRLGE
jgi:hypothetical protein